jgi:hypothetical protein
MLTKHYVGDQMKKKEMDRACGTYGREERWIQSFGGET